jgi:hypothetical protein
VLEARLGREVFTRRYRKITLRKRNRLQ